jgi:glycosyltransferase involved in cell wall biosynthesis
VAHVHSLNRFTDPVALTRLRRRVPVVASVHDVLPHQRRMPAAIEGGLARLLYRQCAVLVVAHEVLADRLTADFGIARDRVCVVPLLIQDPGPDSSVPSDPGDPRGGDLVAPPVNVLFFGVLRRNKGVAELIQAVEGMDATDVVVTFAGRGPDDVEELVRDAARRCSAIRAEVGYVDDDVDSLFCATSSLPYTSMHPQSAVLADAAYRRPVVVTDVGAVGATAGRRHRLGGAPRGCRRAAGRCTACGAPQRRWPSGS